MPPRPGRHGFTLVELSVVLVVIGLLIGGLLVGTDLVQSARVRRQVAQFDQLRSATAAFRLKYDALPGDMPAPAAVGLTNPNFLDRTRIGNGFVDMADGNNPESNWFLKHLFQAGLIPCTGCAGGWDGLTMSQWNAIFTDAAISGDTLVSVYGGPAKTGWAGQQNYAKNYIEICPYSVAGTSSPALRAIATRDAAALDGKVDDGLPGSGTVVPTNSPFQGTRPDYWAANRAASQGAGGAASNVCVSTTTSPPTYNTANTRVLCGLRVEAGF